MKYIVFIVMLVLSCAKQSQRTLDQNQLYLVDYSIEAKLIEKATLEDTYLYFFRNEEMSYKVISENECRYKINNTYKLDLLLLKRPDNEVVNLSIEHCVFIKRDKICTDIDYTHLYKLVSDCNVSKDQMQE